MGGLIDRPWRHLQRTAGALSPTSLDVELHQVRIRAKRVRYAAEALVPVFGKPARRFAGRAAELQTVLGEHQDAVMTVAWLRAQTGGTAARTAFAAGELAGIERQAQATAREAVPAAWRALRPKRLRAWTEGS
jgi:CHAD domain-containing protein